MIRNSDKHLIIQKLTKDCEGHCCREEKGILGAPLQVNRQAIVLLQKPKGVYDLTLHWYAS